MTEEDVGGGDVGKLLEQVTHELGRREAVVRSLEEELRVCETRLAEVAGEVGSRRGDSRRLMAAEQLRRQIRAAAVEVRRRLAEAVADVARARERRALLEEEARGGASGEETD